jgi:hypothetical protein
LRRIAHSDTSRTTPATAYSSFENLETTMRRRSLSFAFGLLFAAAACGGSSDSGTTAPHNNNQNPTATNGTFTATINGVAWGATGTVSVNHATAGLITIAGFGLIGTSTGYSVALAIGNPTGPGTYSLSYLNSNTSQLIIGSGTGAGWTTFSNGGTGTLTVTSLTSDHIVATFTADPVAASGGAGGTIPVRNGKLDVTF